MLSRVRAVVVRHQQFAGWLAGFAVVIGGGYVAITQFTALSVEQRLTAAGILANAVLTFGLLWVYTEMADVQTHQAEVQEQQADILDKQEKWMEANHAPKLAIEPSLISGRDDAFCIQIENRGNGLASNFDLQIEIRRKLGNPLVSVEDGEIHYYIFDPDENLWTPPDFEDISVPPGLTGPQDAELPAGSDGVVIGPDENRSLWAQVSFTGFEDSSHTSWSELSMGQYFRDLENEQIEKVHVSIRLSYQNIVGECDDEPVVEGVVGVESEKTVREVVSEMKSPDDRSITDSERE